MFDALIVCLRWWSGVCLLACLLARLLAGLLVRAVLCYFYVVCA